MATSINGGNNNQLPTSSNALGSSGFGGGGFGGSNNPLDGGFSISALNGGSSSSSSSGPVGGGLGGGSTGSGNPPAGGGSALGQSPWGRLSEVGITNLGDLFKGVGSESSGGNPFGDNPLAAKVLFDGSGNYGGSLFSNVRTNIDNLVSGATGGSNPLGGSGSTVPQSPTSGGGTSILSFGGGGSPIPNEGGGIGDSPSGELKDPFEVGGAFGIPTADSFDFAKYGIPIDGSFGADSDILSSFAGSSGSPIPIEGGGIGGSASGELKDPFGPGGAFGIPTADTFDFTEYGINEGSFGGTIPSGIPGIGGDSGGAIPSGIPGIGGDSGIPSFVSFPS